MLINYFKIGIRNLVKNKLYSAINIMGLSVGLAACVLIALFVSNELSYDKHFKDSENIFRLTGVYNQGGDSKTYSVSTTFPLLPILAANFPEIEAPTRLDNFSSPIIRGDQQINQPNMLIVDSTFFKLFSFESVSGDLEKALDDPNTIVMSESAVKRHFGSEQALNQVVRIVDTDFRIGAIVKDLPDNTHFEAEVFIPMSKGIAWYGDWVHSLFNGTSHYSYFKIAPGTSIAELKARINDFLNTNYEEEIPHQYDIQALESIHLNSDLVGEIGVNGNKTTVLIFIATAIVILFLACINYINLSIAGSFQRGMEVGLKKVFGAKPRAQILQFQIESVIIALIACMLAVVWVEIALPQFNLLTGREFDFNVQEHLGLVLSLFMVALAIGIISGSFPAIFLLKMRIAQVLKTSPLSGGGSSKFKVRNALVVFQFFIAVVLIASTIIILNQIHFLRNADLGINTEQVLVLPIANGDMAGNYEVLKEELLRNPGVVSVSASNNHPASRVGNWRGYRPKGAEENISAPTVIVAHDFFETLNAEMLQGRSFQTEFSTDAMEAYVLNEAAVKFFQLGNDPVGKDLRGLAYTGSEWSWKNARVIGVVKDFHFASLHNSIRPVVFSLSSQATMGLNFLNVRIRPENTDVTISEVEKTWGQFAGNELFSFSFLDEDINAHYQAEDQFLKVFTSFSVLAILIGCLGLYGLTAFMMKKRTKEIGIRKVLGANVSGLVGVISKDFLKLILVANIMGWPLAYFLMDKWLQNFAYKITISWQVFVLTGGCAVLIAFLSIAHHSIKTARTNPVDSIRYE